ncbi:serine hydrolase domain-containing protein [Catelliglobosispora koreensis]|uniref:serine hydrolase domain-containing protein n=1 Tax=Catelliglobosispora koreensis TaxID=129052 RepID=UPI00035C3430|nr:serine hydrolase domain-containing protein [Catelliglobosispora koreensis]
MTHSFRGAAAVTVDGTVVHQIPHTATTFYSLASVGKHICAVAVLAAGLDLHRPVMHWLPDFPDARVTLHHLLSHTSGVGHWRPEIPGFDVDATLPVLERMSLLQQAPLLFEPGSSWLYSSPGYALAGRVLEVATGQDYSSYVNSQIFAPLGVASILAGDPPAGATVASGYRDGEPIETNALSALPGTRDIWATASGLAEFSTLLHSGQLLSPPTLALLGAAHYPMPRQFGLVTTSSYGYGLYSAVVDGKAALLHPGDNPGFRTLVVWFPEPRACIALLSNEETTDPLSVLRSLLRYVP